MPQISIGRLQGGLIRTVVSFPIEETKLQHAIRTPLASLISIPKNASKPWLGTDHVLYWCHSTYVSMSYVKTFLGLSMIARGHFYEENYVPRFNFTHACAGMIRCLIIFWSENCMYFCKGLCIILGRRSRVKTRGIDIVDCFLFAFTIHM